MKAQTLWFTGLSGAGKTTLAKGITTLLNDAGTPCILVDGDDLRKGLTKDLGFDSEARKSQACTAAELCKLLNSQGFWVAAAILSPDATARSAAKDIIGVDRFNEIYVDTPLAECERRDTKGLYTRFKGSTAKYLAGYEVEYQAPEAPFMVIQTHQPEELCVKQLALKITEEIGSGSV